MAQYLGGGLGQLTFGQVDHESGHGKASDGLQRVIQHLSLIVSKHSYVIQVNHYRETAVIWPSLQHIFHHELKVGGSLGETHGHA